MVLLSQVYHLSKHDPIIIGLVVAIALVAYNNSLTGDTGYEYTDAGDFPIVDVGAASWTYFLIFTVANLAIYLMN